MINCGNFRRSFLHNSAAQRAKHENTPKISPIFRPIFRPPKKCVAAILLWGISGITEDFSLLVAFLLLTFSWLVGAPLLSRHTGFGPLSRFFRVFSWLFRGPRFGQNVRVLALERVF